MKGDAVLHPMGWDAFGLPAENEAIDKGVHPATARPATRQLQAAVADDRHSYDWEREVNSSDPAYYRWTQWIFLLLYRRGLAYQALAPVNWCETCQTTLANEEVEEGACWRCHRPVTRRDLKQWFFRHHHLRRRAAGRDRPPGLAGAHPAMQRNWIGRSEGSSSRWPWTAGPACRFASLPPPDTSMHDFAVLAPEHPLVNQITAPEQRAAVAAYASGPGAPPTSSG